MFLWLLRSKGHKVNTHSFLGQGHALKCLEKVQLHANAKTVWQSCLVWESEHIKGSRCMFNKNECLTCAFTFTKRFLAYFGIISSVFKIFTLS